MAKKSLLSRDCALSPLILFATTIIIVAMTGCDVAGTGSSSKESPDVSRDQATAWMRLTNEIVQAEGLVEPPAARIHAYTGIGYFEGVHRVQLDLYRTAAGQLNGLSALPDPEAGATYDWVAVAASTESHVLRGLLPNASEQTYVRIDSLRAQQVAARQSAGVPPSTLERSKDYGERLADSLLAWARRDGYQATRGRSYDRPEGPETWQPTPPDYQSAREPHWAELRPFVIDLGAHQPEAPPPYSEDTSSVFYKQMKEVYETSQELTDREVATARYWNDAPGSSPCPSGHWVAIARQVANQKNLGPVETARLFALTGIANADGFISVWKSKYRYSYIRPVTAIRRLLDGDWLPVVETPPFPEYTSGHSVQSMAAAEVLRSALDGPIAFTNRLKTDPDKSAFGAFEARSYDSFYEAANEVALSRVLGGKHFPMAAERGLDQGKTIGEAIAGRIQLRRE